MKISVYITSYNQCALLREAIDSVIAQTLRPHEIIIVDDASSDGSADVIRAYAQRHPDWVKPVLHTRNQGVAQVRVDALSAVTGDHVSYVDGDDRMLPTKLEREAAALARNPGVELAFSNHFNMTAAGERLDTWIRPGDAPPPVGDVFLPVFGREFPRRDIFRMELVSMAAVRRAGLHDPALAAFEDFDWRIRLSKQARACYVDEPLFEIRRHGGGLSAARAEQKLVQLRRIYARNRTLLADRTPAERGRARRRYHQWMAPFARQAAHAALHDPARPLLGRRLTAAARLLFVARYSPDALTLGDVYCLFLPARTAEHEVY